MYRAADSLSLRFAKQYRRILSGLAATGTLLTLAFLLYDEKEMIPMILLCGAMLVCAILLSGRAARTACHRRYIEYRALAEAMRVQMFLRYAGSRVEAQRLMSWTQQTETAWILCAVCAVNAQKPAEKARDIRECWVRDQEAYHTKAGRLVFRPVIKMEDPDTFRVVMKIVLGTLSAGTLFLSGYYGKMNLERETTDHGKMTAFFRTMSERIAAQGQTESLMETLAREELAENGSWCSYRKDAEPELDL